MNTLLLLDTSPGLVGVYLGLALPLMVWVMWGHFVLIFQRRIAAGLTAGAVKE